MNLSEVKTEGTSIFYSSLVAFLSDKPPFWCHRSDFTQAEGNSVALVLGFMIFTDFDLKAFLPFYVELTENFFWLKQKPPPLFSMTVDWDQALGSGSWINHEKHIERVISIRRVREFIYFIFKHSTLIKSPESNIKGYFSCRQTFCGGNIIWSDLQVRKHQVFKYTFYRLRRMYQYVSRD